MIVILILHIILCIIAICFVRGKGRYSNTLVLPLVIGVPIGGFILMLIDEYLERRSEKGINGEELDELKLNNKNKLKMEAYSDENEITVPLEEAMAINDAKTRRMLMLDILHKNPNEYTELLQKTTSNSDVELTHFATTTIMEIQGEYELKLQELEKKVKNDQDNYELLTRYLELLIRYIESGLLTGNILLIKRLQLREWLEHLLKYYPKEKRYYFKSIENELEMKQYRIVESLLQYAKKQWPEEKVYQYYVTYYFETGQGKKIKDVLKEVKDNNVYLSSEGLEWYQFWDEEN